MRKIIVMFRAKQGLSKEDFRQYYESSHVPLILKHLPFIKSYKRNYIDQKIMRMPDGMSSPGFDIITEVKLETDEDFESYLRIVSRPEVFREILADEANFIEPNSIWRLSVTEVETKL